MSSAQRSHSLARPLWFERTVSSTVAGADLELDSLAGRAGGGRERDDVGLGDDHKGRGHWRRGR